MTRHRSTNNIWKSLQAVGGIGAIALSLAIASSAAQGAVRTADDPFFGLAPLDNRELASMRGGLDRGPFHYDFVVTIRSMVQEAIAETKQRIKEANEAFGLMTTLKLNGVGKITSSKTTTIGTNDNAHATVSETEDTVAASISDTQTKVAQEVSQDHVKALTQNLASGRNIVHELTLDINVADFQQKVAQFRRLPLISKVTRDVGMSSLGGGF
jgi:hypothetical protein